MAKKKKSQNKEILWNIINSLLAGALVFVGACTSGSLNLESVTAAVIASGAVALTQFKNYWNKEEIEYSARIFNFVKI